VVEPNLISFQFPSWGRPFSCLTDSAAPSILWRTTSCALQPGWCLLSCRSLILSSRLGSSLSVWCMISSQRFAAASVESLVLLLFHWSLSRSYYGSGGISIYSLSLTGPFTSLN
jgi:hypothetical protein